MDRWSQLSMSEKSDLMSLYIRNGISSLEEIKKHYNSYQDGGKITFQQWKDRMKTKYPDIEMDNDKAGYNYEEYFNNNYDAAIRQLDNLQHFPDTYKLPNHPTFSNESIYSRGPMIGGNWINDSTFNPSIINRRYYPNTYREDRPYTEREIYNSFATGGHLYQDGGSDNKTFIHSQASETGWMPEVDIVSEKPAWQRGLTDYDWARARQYYSDADGYLTTQGIEFLKNISSKRTTGQSNFMRDVNKLSYIPNAAVGAIGAIPAAAGLIAATTNPVVDALLTAQAIATAPKNIKEGIKNIQEGNTWQGIGDLGLTALDFLGAGQLVGRTSRMLNKGYRAKHAYNTIIPISYENATKRGKEWLHNMWYNNEIDSKKLRDVYEEEVYKALRKNHALSNEDVKKLTPIIADNREDAFRLYLKMPQKHNTYTRLNNGHYRMNEASIPDLLLPYLNSKNDPGFTHGGLWSADFYVEPETNLGLWHYTDRWDLNPFQRQNLSPIKRAVNKLNNFETQLQDIAQNYRRKKYESGKWGNGNYSWLNSTLNRFRTDGRMPWQTREELSYIKQLSNKIENSKTLKKLEDKIKNIEVGNLLGGEPFMMETIIPYKVTENNVERLKGFTNDELDGLYTIINDKNKVNINYE